MNANNKSHDPLVDQALAGFISQPSIISPIVSRAKPSASGWKIPCVSSQR